MQNLQNNINVVKVNHVLDFQVTTSNLSLPNFGYWLKKSFSVLLPCNVFLCEPLLKWSYSLLVTCITVFHKFLSIIIALNFEINMIFYVSCFVFNIKCSILFPPVLHFPNIYSFGLFILVGFGNRIVFASPNDLVPLQACSRRGITIINLTTRPSSAAATSLIGEFGVEQAPTSCPLLGSQPAYTEHAFWSTTPGYTFY